jgi:hypothetical protein
MSYINKLDFQNSEAAVFSSETCQRICCLPVPLFSYTHEYDTCVRFLVKLIMNNISGEGGG